MHDLAVESYVRDVDAVSAVAFQQVYLFRSAEYLMLYIEEVFASREVPYKIVSCARRHDGDLRPVMTDSTVYHLVERSVTAAGIEAQILVGMLFAYFFHIARAVACGRRIINGIINTELFGSKSYFCEQ